MRKRDVILFSAAIAMTGILALPYAAWRFVCWLLFDPKGDD